MNRAWVWFNVFIRFLHTWHYFLLIDSMWSMWWKKGLFGVMEHLLKNLPTSFWEGNKQLSPIISKQLIIEWKWITGSGHCNK